MPNKIEKIVVHIPKIVNLLQASTPRPRDRRGVERFMEMWDAPLGMAAHMGEIDLEPPVLEVPLCLLHMLC